MVSLPLTATACVVYVRMFSALNFPFAMQFMLSLVNVQSAMQLFLQLIFHHTRSPVYLTNPCVPNSVFMLQETRICDNIL
jgi:hypothetical protein